MTETTAMRKRLVAACGKGGTGKTVFTSMMTKVLLDGGKAGKLLLIDADPAMGLPLALGVDVKRTMGQIREEIIKTARSAKADEKRRVTQNLDYMAFEALNETDGFALLAMGRTETLGCYCPVNSILKDTISSLSRSFDTILIDGEAGLEQINRQVVGQVDTLIIVTDATSRGLKTAEQIERMVHVEKVIKTEKLGMVFNRVHGNEDVLKKAAADIGVEVFGFIPQDEKIAYYDLMGKSILGLTESSALEAARDIVSRHIFPERFQ